MMHLLDDFHIRGGRLSEKLTKVIVKQVLIRLDSLYKQSIRYGGRSL